VENLMKGVLKEEMLQYMRIRLHDAGPVTRDSSEARRLLFDSDQLTNVSPTQPGIGNSDSVFVHVLPLEIASRVWEFQYSPPTAACSETTRGSSGPMRFRKCIPRTRNRPGRHSLTPSTTARPGTWSFGFCFRTERYVGSRAIAAQCSMRTAASRTSSPWPATSRNGAK